MSTQPKPRECPCCHTTYPEDLQVFHYTGLKGSTHIECQCCGSEFSIEEAEEEAETTRAIKQVLLTPRLNFWE